MQSETEDEVSRRKLSVLLEIEDETNFETRGNFYYFGIILFYLFGALTSAKTFQMPVIV